MMPRQTGPHPNTTLKIPDGVRTAPRPPGHRGGWVALVESQTTPLHTWQGMDITVTRLIPTSVSGMNERAPSEQA